MLCIRFTAAVSLVCAASSIIVLVVSARPANASTCLVHVISASSYFHLTVYNAAMANSVTNEFVFTGSTFNSSFKSMDVGVPVQRT